MREVAISHVVQFGKNYVLCMRLCSTEPSRITGSCTLTWADCSCSFSGDNLEIKPQVMVRVCSFKPLVLGQKLLLSAAPALMFQGALKKYFCLHLLWCHFYLVFFISHDFCFPTVWLTSLKSSRRARKCAPNSALGVEPVSMSPFAPSVC